MHSNKLSQLKIIGAIPTDLHNILTMTKCPLEDDLVFIERLIKDLQAYISTFKNEDLINSLPGSLLLKLLVEKKGVCRHQATVATLIINFILKTNNINAVAYYSKNNFHAFPLIIIPKQKPIPVYLAYDSKDDYDL